MFKRILLLLTLLVAPLCMIPASVSAIDVINKAGCDSAPNAAASVDNKNNKTTGENPLFGPQGALTKVIGILSLIVGIVAIIIIIMAGLRFITSGANPQDVANARERVIYACVALIIAILAQVFVRFIIGRI